MKKEQVPQDDAKVLQGKFKVVKYAVEADGQYTKVQTVGWEPENIVLEQAWEAIDEETENIRKAVLAGKKSPLAYHMARQMMDASMIAGYTGQPAFLVKLDCRPWFFNRLSLKKLEKYATALRITIDDLKNIA